MIIYKIENLINGKIYIGQTVKSVSKRVTQHLRSRFPIGRAIRKYGIQSFSISVIDEAQSKNVLHQKEKYWISHFNSLRPNGYNVTSGGEGTDGPNTEEWKRNLRKPRGPMTEENKEIHRIASMRPDVIKANRDRNTGRKLTVDHREKISAGLKGRIVTEETRNKLRAWERTESYLAKLRKPCSEERRNKIIEGKRKAREFSQCTLQ